MAQARAQGQSHSEEATFSSLCLRGPGVQGVGNIAWRYCDHYCYQQKVAPTTHTCVQCLVYPMQMTYIVLDVMFSGTVTSTVMH